MKIPTRKKRGAFENKKRGAFENTCDSDGHLPFQLGQRLSEERPKLALSLIILGISY